MKNYSILFLLLVFCCFSQKVLLAQSIYPTKFEGCNTSRFALESEEETAKIDNETFVNTITKHIDPKILKKTRGILNLQVIVYEDGSCCLISIDNKTNKSASNLNFQIMKRAIDSELTWINGEKNVAALIEASFKKGQVTIKRFGLDGNIGMHVLKKE